MSYVGICYRTALSVSIYIKVRSRDTIKHISSRGLLRCTVQMTWAMRDARKSGTMQQGTVSHAFLFVST